MRNCPIDVVITHGDDACEATISLTAESVAAVRLTFNPSGRRNVHHLKAIAAAFLTLADEILRENPSASIEINAARHSMITASMWGVMGATKDLET
jgi:hypothetical protein